MKQKLSISMDAEKVAVIERIIAEGRFRNKSHIIEYALSNYLSKHIDKKNENVINNELEKTNIDIRGEEKW